MSEDFCESEIKYVIFIPNLWNPATVKLWIDTSTPLNVWSMTSAPLKMEAVAWMHTVIQTEMQLDFLIAVK